LASSIFIWLLQFSFGSINFHLASSIFIWLYQFSYGFFNFHLAFAAVFRMIVVENFGMQHHLKLLLTERGSGALGGPPS
jgi:hypothetical protein